MTEESESVLYGKKLQGIDEKFRGEYLFWASVVEQYLNGLISWFFFPNDSKKNPMLVGYIINDINFNKKISIFLKLLKKFNPDVLKKYSSLNKDFENIRSLRNKLAHARLDTTLEYLKQKPNKIRLEYWDEDQIQFLEFSTSDIEKKIIEIYQFHMTLIQIMEELTGESQHSFIDVKFDSKKP